MDHLPDHKYNQGDPVKKNAQSLQDLLFTKDTRARHAITTMSHSAGTDNGYSKARPDILKAIFDPID